MVYRKTLIHKDWILLPVGSENRIESVTLVENLSDVFFFKQK